MPALPDLSSTLPGVLSQSPSVGFLGTETECRSFDFFRQNTAVQLSGFFGGDFWETLLLQAALHEPSIRYAILALGSLHASFEQDGGLAMRCHINGSTDDLASKNYSLAISLLVKPRSQETQQAIDVHVVCSILFACLETMQSRYGSAIAHVQSGMKILCEDKHKEETFPNRHDVLRVSEIPYVSIGTLEEMFVRLDLQAIQMISWPKWNMSDSMGDLGQKRETPSMFSKLSKARESLASQWLVASHSESDMWDPSSMKLSAIPPAAAWQKKSRSILARWSSAYDVYLDIRGDNLTGEKRRGTAALRILKELGSTAMMLPPTIVDDQKDWDALCPMFRNIVSLAEDIIEVDGKSTAVRPTFCIDMALVGPLFQVCCRCRHPIIRRKAILILQNCGRTEGIWDAFSTSKVAQRVLDIEEAGLQDVRTSEDVPGWARIANVSPVFDPMQQRAILSYTRQGSEHDLTRRVIEEVIEW